MPGELWRQLTQVAKEVTYGVQVPATRQMLFTKFELTRTRAAHIIEVATGTPDNVRGIKNRAVAAGGTGQQTLDPDECIELFLSSIQGGVTPVASAAIANPTTAPTGAPSSSGGTMVSGTYLYGYTDVGLGGAETAISTLSAGQVVTGPTGSVVLSGVLVGAAGTLSRKIYRNFAGGAYGPVGSINDNTTTTFTDTGVVTNAAAAAGPPSPAVNQTGSGAQIWTFKPSTTLDSQTWEQYDGYQAWVETGSYIDTLKLTWSAEAAGDTMVDITLFGKDRTQMTGNAITGSLATRAPIWIEGWETAVFIDALGAAAGSTPFGYAISGTVTINRHLGRKYFATNTQSTSFVPLGKFDMTFELLIEGNANWYQEYLNWDASTPRLIRIQMGNNTAVLGASKLSKKVMFDVPGYYTVADLTGENQGTQVAKMSGNYSYDSVNAYSLGVTVVSSRSTAY